MTNNIVYTLVELQWDTIIKHIGGFKAHEVGLVLGGARKKYNREGEQGVTTSHEVAVRQVVKEDHEDDFKHAVRRTAYALGDCYDKNTGEIFPDYNTVIYMTINPRDVLKSWNALNMKINETKDVMLRGNGMNTGNMRTLKNISNKHFSMMQKEENTSRKPFTLIDVDWKTIELRNKYWFKFLNDFMNLNYEIYDNNDITERMREQILYVTKTRTGLHIVMLGIGNAILKGLDMEGFWPMWKEDYHILDLEMMHDRITPVWGTMQGGEMVHPLYIKEYGNYDGWYIHSNLVQTAMEKLRE